MNLQSIFRVMTLVVVMLAVNTSVNAQTTATTPRQPSELTFTVRSATLEVGETKTLTVTGLGKDERAEWESSNKDIVIVDKEGTITGQREGKATITATAGDRKATCDVTVSAKLEEKPITNDVEKSTIDDASKR
jgi:uncharacterized protein YjdB